MARLFSRTNGVVVILAVVVFAGIVFLLFRSRLAGPQEAAASDGTPVSTEADGGGEAALLTVAGTASDGGASLVPGQDPSGEADSMPAGTPSPQRPEVDAAITETVNLIRSQPGELIRARDKLNKLLQGEITPEQRQTIKDEMARLSKDWLFGPAAFPGDMLCDTYTVRRGDLLDVLGRRMKVPYEMLMQINNIQRPQALQAGRALKVVHGPFHVKVNRSAFTLDLYLQDMYVRSFKVGLGKPGYETPTGRWRVQERGKLIRPPWTDPDTGRQYKSSDPDYPLGTRWIGLDGVDGAAKGRTGFAIHGTKEPEQIGTAGSRGCIRMYNDDVELMYSLLAPLYSQVDVAD